MAKQLKLSAQVRTSAGRSAVKKIKQQGFVPAVIYGRTHAPQNLQIDAREFSNILAHATGEHLVVELEISGEGKSEKNLAIIQEVQHEPVKGSVLHVDFHAVAADEKVHAEIPVEAVGEANGVKNYGGILEISLHSIEVECLPKDLPEIIRIDVSALNVNDAIHIRDLQLPAGVTAKGDADLTVVRIAPPTVQGAAAAEAAGSPEVIKEKKEEGAK